MSAERRNSIRFPVAPTRIDAEIEVGKDVFQAQLLDESMAGFAVAIEVPRRKLGAGGFTSEAECYLFGEIARLRIAAGSCYEVQIISIVPRDDSINSSTRSRVSLRIGTRIVREIPNEHRNSWGRNLRLSAVILLALTVSAFCTMRTFSGQLLAMIPETEFQLADLANFLEPNADKNWNAEIAHARQHGYVVPGEPQMMEFLATTDSQPALHRVQRIFQFQENHPFLKRLNLSQDQELALRQIALESSAKMEFLWQEMQTQLDRFEQELVELLVELETKIFANLTPEQAKIWVHGGLA